MSSIRDRLRRLHRPHAPEGTPGAVDEAERLRELERVIAADAERAAQNATRTPSVSTQSGNPTATPSPSDKAHAPVAGAARSGRLAPPRSEPDAGARSARPEPSLPLRGENRPVGERAADSVAAPRAAVRALPPPSIHRSEDDDTLRFVPLDELDPGDNRLRRRKAADPGARRSAEEPLPVRTTIGKDTSFLSLVSSRRFDAWKQRQAEPPPASPAATREVVYEPEHVHPEPAPRSPAATRSRAPQTPTAARQAPHEPRPVEAAAPHPAAHPPLISLRTDAAVRQPATPLPARAAAQLRGGVHLAQALEGRWLAGAHGPCFAAVERVETDSLFGTVRLGEPFDLPASTWASLLPERAESLADLVFLDLETTGTEPTTDMAFILGLGRASRTAFEVEQIAVHHPGEEMAALGALLARLRDARGIVTFNGQRFDLRFLRTRMARHGIDASALDRLHLDLYLLARKAWGRQQPRYRLVDLEQNVLGFGRVDDVPGAEAPRRYARYRATGDIREIVPVFEHNRHDIVAMFPLLGRIAAQLERGRRAAID